MDNGTDAAYAAHRKRKITEVSCVMCNLWYQPWPQNWTSPHNAPTRNDITSKWKAITTSNLVKVWSTSALSDKHSKGQGHKVSQLLSLHRCMPSTTNSFMALSPGESVPEQSPVLDFMLSGGAVPILSWSPLARIPGELANPAGTAHWMQADPDQLTQAWD